MTRAVCIGCAVRFICVVFFNDTATTEIYTLSLHDALPISDGAVLGAPLLQLADPGEVHQHGRPEVAEVDADHDVGDRKSTRLNSSHANISYAVFCLKKKTNRTRRTTSIRQTPKHKLLSYNP